MIYLLVHGQVTGKLKPLSELKCVDCRHFYKFKNETLFPTVRAFCRKRRLYFKAENNNDLSNCLDFESQEIKESQPQTPTTITPESSIEPPKIKESSNAESLQKSHAFRYAITHKTYETHCFSCPHLLGYYSDSEGKFGTVECDTEVCNKR